VGDGFENEATKPVGAKNVAPRERVIHLATRCAAEAEFVERFAAFTTDKVLTMPGKVALPPDVTARFVIALASRAPMLEGRCRVLASPVGTPDNKVRLEFVELSPRSQAVHAKLLRAGAAAKPKSMVPPPPLPSKAPPPLTARTAGGSKLPPPLAAIPSRAPMTGLLASPKRPVPAAMPASVSVATPVERAPGASFQLPANPFGKVESEALESFVECTLFEEDGAPPPRLEINDDGPTAVGRITVPRAGEAPSIEEWAEGQQTPVARAPKNLAQQAAALIDELASREPERTTAKFGSDLMASAYSDGLIASVPGAHRDGEPAVVSAMPMVAMSADPTELLPTQALPPERRRLSPLLALTFAAGILIGGVAGFVLRGGSTTPVVASVADRAATADTTTVERATPVEGATPAPAPVADPAVAPTVARTEAPTSATAPGPCLVDIVTNPPGALASWNDTALGQTPISGATVPCGIGKVSLQKPNFRPLTIEAEGVAGTTARVEQDLRAPMVRLAITSTPPGSVIQLNKRKLGTTPRTLLVPAKTITIVRVMRAGHAPWLRKVYPTLALTKIHAPLVPLAKPPAAKAPVKAATAAAPSAKPTTVVPKTPFPSTKTATVKR